MTNGTTQPGTESPEPGSLEALEARLRCDLAYLNYPPKNWVKPLTPDSEDEAFDVVVIGGGMVGIASAFALMRNGIANIAVVDAADTGQEGPWVTTARMRTLRSPKILLGPAMGMAALTFRAWFVAQHGGAAWEELGRIPRVQWMEYLRWYRHVLEIPVRNNVRVDAIAWRDGRMTLETSGPEGARRLSARRVVLATGRDGLGGPSVPPEADGIEPHRWAHSNDDIDFDRLAGRRVAVIGGGASAFDNGAMALEAGAAEVRMFIRRPDIPRINKLTGIGNPGLVHGWHRLPDAWKWRCLNYNDTCQTPPPSHSIRRVTDFPNGHVHTGCPIAALRGDGDAVILETPKGTYRCDFILFGTGFVIDFSRHPEIAGFTDNILTWREVYEPPPDERNAALAAAPYLGEMFQFIERRNGDTPGLDRLHCMNFAATLSHGKLTGDIPSVSHGADRLARGIAAAFLAEDMDHHYARLRAYDVREVDGDEWIDEPLPGA